MTAESPNMSECLRIINVSLTKKNHRFFIRIIQEYFQMLGSSPEMRLLGTKNSEDCNSALVQLILQEQVGNFYTDIYLLLGFTMVRHKIVPQKQFYVLNFT